MNGNGNVLGRAPVVMMSVELPDSTYFFHARCRGRDVQIDGKTAELSEIARARIRALLTKLRADVEEIHAPYENSRIATIDEYLERNRPVSQ